MTASRCAQLAISIAGLICVLTFVTVADTNYGYSFGAGKYTPVIRLIATLFLAVLFLRQVLAERRSYLDFLSFSLLLYLCIGTVVGLSYSGPTYEYSRHLFAAVSMLVAYLCGRAYGGLIIEQRETLLRWSWIIAITAIAVFVFCIPALDSPGFSLSPGPVLFSLDVALHTGNTALAAGAFIISMFGNKRAVLMGACIIIAIWWFLQKPWKTSHKAVASIGFSAALFIALSLAMTGLSVATSYFGSNIVLFSRAERITDAVKNVLPTPGANIPTPETVTNEPAPSTISWLERFSSSRVSLMAGAIDEFDDTTATILFGKGFGVSYDWVYWSDNFHAWQKYTQSQIDIAPLWFALTGGVISAALVVGAIVWSLLRLFMRIVLVGNAPIGAAFVLGFALDQLLSFQPNMVIFWLLMGSSMTWLNAQPSAPPIPARHG